MPPWKWTALAAMSLTIAACADHRDRVQIPANAVIPLSDQFTGDYSLLDVAGNPVETADFHGRTALIYFGFASCPDVCPAALGTISAALNELSDADIAGLAPIFITVDPARDTPEALKAYLSFDERLLGLTGSPDAINQAKQSFKVLATREALPDSALGYTMQHTSLFYLVDKKGDPKFAIRDGVSPQELAAILRREL